MHKDRSNNFYWRFIIFAVLLGSYSLLIYVSVNPPPKPTEAPSHPPINTIPAPPPSTPKPIKEAVDLNRPEIEKKVTVLVKVHKRADIAIRAAFSVYELYPTMEILMIDDSPTPITTTLPPTAKYHRIPENTGISYGRNYGVNMTTTEYLLIMDDDWLLTPTTALLEAFHLIESNRTLGIVAGMLCNREPLDGCYGYQGSLGIVDGLLTYKEHDIREDMGNGCKLVDLAENVILARTAILKQYPWDYQLTNAEHEDFYLTLKGHVSVASCDWFKILHKRPNLSAYAGYFDDRNLSANQDRLCKKWNLRGFNMMYTEWQRACP